MDDPVEEVVRVQGPIEAEVVRGILVSYGITVQLSSRVPHSVLPFTVDGLGEVRVLVPSQSAERAREILARHRQAGLVVLPGGREAEASGPRAEPETPAAGDEPDDEREGRR